MTGLLPTPAYDQDGVRLYLGDCRDLLAALPAESVSCCMTSPPFWGLRVYQCPPGIWGGAADCPHRLQPEPAPAGGSTVGERSTLEGSIDGMEAAKGVAGGYSGRRRWQHAGVSRQETPDAWVNHAGDSRGGSGTPTSKSGRGEGYARAEPRGATCSVCGAWRGWYGLEPTVKMYVEHTVEILAAIRRVLRPDGVVWWDLDDSRGGSGKGHAGQHPGPKQASNAGSVDRVPPTRDIPKSLCLIPQAVVVAARDDGWIVRSQIIIPTWMPESAGDRPTDAYRTLLMLSKSNRPAYFWNEKTRAIARRAPAARAEGVDYELVWRETRKAMVRRSFWHGQDYWYDGAGVRVPTSTDYRQIVRGDHRDQDIEARGGLGALSHGETSTGGSPDGLRNLGNVWDDLPPSNYPAAHFATFPVEEPDRCIRATCPPQVCPKCGKPRVRITKATTHFEGGSGRAGRTAAEVNASGKWAGMDPRAQQGENIKLGPVVDVRTVGWTDCGCGVGFEPGLVLDPFIGTGTTAMAAVKLGRRCIGLDASQDYVKQAITRLSVGDAGVRRIVDAQRAGVEQPTLFDQP